MNEEIEPRTLSASRIRDLIFKRLSKSLTVKEKEELKEWVKASNSNQKIYQSLINPNELRKGVIEYTREKNDLWHKIINALPGLSEAPVRDKDLFNDTRSSRRKLKGFVLNLKRKYKKSNENSIGT